MCVRTFVQRTAGGAGADESKLSEQSVSAWRPGAPAWLHGKLGADRQCRS
jgi:hypothetical protein